MHEALTIDAHRSAVAPY
ncbi:MAG: hypothetical protein L0K96_09195 [Corynebacterium flavescens]|nr:hypothetical protein [Corynebacterium flavescens]